jgi:hypothetical protein
MHDLAAAEHRRMSSGTSLYSTNPWLVFGLYCLVYLFFNWYLQKHVLTDDVYTYSLGAAVNPEKLAAFLKGQHRMEFLSYVFVPLMIVIKMLLVSFCLMAGLLLTAQKLSFSTIFKIVLFAESAFCASTLFRLLVLAFSHTIDSLGQYMAFAPLSLFSLFRPTSVPNWMLYPLQTLDVFQVIYVFFLARGLQYFLRRPFKASLEQVVGSYGLGLFTAMIFFAFLSITFNP